MSIINEKYSANRVQLLKQMLLNDYQHNQPRDYEIKVDDLKVVQRTNDPERFFQHEEFIQPDTRCVTISIFEGSSRNCTKYHLHLHEMPAQAQGLGGIDHIINEKVALHKQQLEMEQLKSRYNELEGDLEEAEEENQQLLLQIEELKQKKLNLNQNLGTIASHMVEGLLVRNAGKLKQIPVIGDLAGLIESSDNLKALPAPEHVLEGAASFSKKSALPAGETVSELSEEQKVFLNNGRWLSRAFGKEDMGTVFSILKAMSDHPQIIGDIWSLLHESGTEQPNKSEPLPPKEEDFQLPPNLV